MNRIRPFFRQLERSRIHVVSFIAIMVLSLQGCIWIEDTSDLRAFVNERQSRPVGEIPPLPEFIPYEAFIYEAASLRNPFLPIIPEVAQQPELISDVFPDPDRIKEYLEQYALERLVMVGSITSPVSASDFFVLIRDPLGEVHRIQIGDFMGTQHGQVVGLDERRIELSEIVSNGRGGWMKRPRTITLQEVD